MLLTTPTYALWTITGALEAVLCVFAVRTRLWRRLPLFAAYAFTKFLVTAALLSIYAGAGYNSAFAYHFYWSAQLVLLLGRAGVCAELCWMTFKSRPGLWIYAKAVLIGIGVGVLVYLGVDAYRQDQGLSSVILSLDRSLELNIVILLTSFLLIANRYRVQMERVPFIIATGLCAHSAFWTLNNSVLKHWLGSGAYFAWWNYAQMVSFQIVLMVWIFAVKKPMREPRAAPALLPKEVYYSYRPLIRQRLAELDHRIQEVMSRD